ncbi:cell wall-binding repeat-containing protein [Jeotgalibacillus soli]|uniref:Lactocepin n=1 Tax=Jeotgalibacillus soli TaxID=889306 RepID=A0A0C2S778_9BACL|nr:cell wall-binding repeat-containing protein [Jeotgalibacillus soli]KIL49879.1 hypothetical protein KP78_13470 [Jeotgalibacillus soli]
MSKHWKKYLTVAMASSLVLGNSALAFGQEGNKVNKDTNKEVPVNVLSNSKAKLAKLQQEMGQVTDAKSSLKNSDDVRVIVELSGQTALQYATEKGVLYKELSTEEKESFEQEALTSQEKLKNSIRSQAIKIDYKNNFTASFNGISGIIKFKDLEKIEKLPGVEKVYIANEYERPEVEPDMDTSHEFIQSYQTWADAKFKGEGMIVSVIDSGVDPDHKDFIISEGVENGLTAEEVAQLQEGQNLRGEYYSEKVPYGYNYYDLNNTIKDIGPGASEHGMHVSGTVAANGDTENGGIKGVAPEAQVLGMKVFSNDPLFPSTYSDIYLAAIDDSIKLGADVLNMSLGSVASFYEQESPEDLAITRAVENGIVSSVSAGNSGHIGYGYDNPHYDNPDIGVVGAPGLNADTIQVAATGNVVNLYTHTINGDGVPAFKGYGVDDWSSLANVEVVSLKALSGKPNALGSPSDYQGIDVTGKVVVVERGQLTFFDKTVNAARAGAAGIIVYNSTAPTFFKDQGGWDIPFMKIERAAGLALEQALADGGQLSLDVNQTAVVEGPEVGRSTDFTSWGVTPDLEFKPELSAPGGSILSTLNDDQYGVMSGTSMAAPHVAGGSALVQQYLLSDDRFAGYTADERTRLAKALLLNTADVVHDLEGQPISPRRQGAGMMQTYAAVSTPVFVTESITNEAKVNLKDFTSNTVTMTLTATNLTETEAKYTVTTSVLADSFEETASVTYNALVAKELVGAIVHGPETVVVPANGSVDFSITLDLSNAQAQGTDALGNEVLKDLPLDQFVEGFVKLESTDIGNPDLVVPYLGFYGAWDRPEIVDHMTLEGGERFYEDYLFPYDMLEGDGFFVDSIDVNGQQVYPLSPENNDGFYDDIYPLPTFLRNAKEVQFGVLDAGGTQLRTISLENNVRKNFFNNGNGSYFSFNPSRSWDGLVQKNGVEDGVYLYEIKSRVDYDGAAWQSKQIPVYVDNTEPIVEGLTYNKETNTVGFAGVDEGVGVLGFDIYINSTDIQPTAFFPSGTTSVNLNDFGINAEDVVDINIVAYDQAGNLGFAGMVAGDTTDPVILLDDNAPAPLVTYNTRTIPVAGEIVEAGRLKSLKVNGEEVPFSPAAAGTYVFSSEVVVDSDGKHDITFEVTDWNGNSTSIARGFYVDTAAPGIVVNTDNLVGNSVDQVEVDVLLRDNFQEIELSLNNNVLFSSFNASSDYLKPFEGSVPVTLDLELGVNVFEFVAIDTAGNETVYELSITRNESELFVNRVYGEDRYATAIELSQSSWDTAETVILARGDNFADALAGVPLSKKHDAPLLLSRPTAMPQATFDEIKRLSAKHVYVLGGDGAISPDIVTQLKNYGIKVTRLSGENRMETASKIAGEFGTAKEAVLVNALNFPDALSVASYAAERNMPILLTDGKTLPKATQDALVKLKTQRTFVIGGTGVISEEVAKQAPGAYRLAGANRYETSLAVAKFFGHTSDTAYFATGANYADALAGAATAAKNGSALYLVGGTVPEALGSHLQAADHIRFAKVIGGTIAVSDEVLLQLNEYLEK